MKFKNRLLIFILGLFLSHFSSANDFQSDTNSIKSVYLVTNLKENGQFIASILLEYEDTLLVSKALNKLYTVSVTLEGKSYGNRHIKNTYTTSSIENLNTHSPGKYVVIQLSEQDTNSDLYSIIESNTTPITVKSNDGSKQIIQKNKIPQFYNAALEYQISQIGNNKLLNGQDVLPFTITVNANKNNIINPLIDNFQKDNISISKKNYLNYRLYVPKTDKNNLYPLTVFLHGSGQVGKDNLAQLLSSQGAIATLSSEEGFVIAPQYESIFDPFDVDNGFHWQTENRRKLLNMIIEKTLKQYPQIDKKRIYLIGLSRGAEGALYLLLDNPDLFAGALLISGREAYTKELMDGNASEQNLDKIKHLPIWFFHSRQDKIAPVHGTIRNVEILKKLGADNIKYTEFNFNHTPDNGFISNNAHNAWEAVFNSKSAVEWLLSQHKQ
ncbi:alpha/beta hydrolase-fold protein [Spirabiliibacterium falconis]|uniref:alpha/beta hydrolase-fold protein n=1 Tax=Spirabiliibacterium falconis TaxID=572023 RepID=UPI001AAD8716|nr:alpha/beta hydrolase-fold protein [Spirabiliibacterium falconis]MBE2894570.1 phospholipase [Spirabiliibacterium falconis]